MAKMLTNDTIELRALEPDDLSLLYLWESQRDAWLTSNTTAPYSRHSLWKYQENYDADIYSSQQLRMMIVRLSDGAAVGTIDIFHFSPANRRAELGIFVAEAYRRQGLALAALSVSMQYAFTRLGLHQLYATVAAGNAAARSLFARAGFTTTATLSDWLLADDTHYHDALLMQRPRV